MGKSVAEENLERAKDANMRSAKVSVETQEILKSIGFPNKEEEFNFSIYLEAWERQARLVETPPGIKRVACINPHASTFYIHEGVEEICPSALANSMLTKISMPTTLHTIGMDAVRGTYIRSLTIPSGVRHIGDQAFYGCARLTTLTFDEGIKEIEGTYVFGGCTSLSDVSFPKSLKSTGENMFYRCTALTSIVLPETLETVKPYTFSNTGLTSIVFENANVDLQHHAFSNCKSLVEIELPLGLKEVSTSIFEGCTSLTKVSLPEGFEKIGARSFYGCGKLASVLLSQDIKEISTYAFFNCASLKHITINSSTIYIGAYAFLGCNGLEHFDIKTPIFNLDSEALNGIPNTCIVSFPENMLYEDIEKKHGFPWGLKSGTKIVVINSLGEREEIIL